MMATFNRTQTTTDAPRAQRMRRGLYVFVAMLALCVAALVPSGAANADELEQIQVNVPTKVPSHVMPDGEVVLPTDWSISNTGTAIARLSGVTASDVYERLQISATVDGDSEPFFALADGKPSLEKTIDVQGGASVKVNWAFSKLDAVQDSDLLAKAAQGDASVAKLALTFKCVQSKPVGFAVYSNYKDDAGAEHNTLKFYKRDEVPTEGETFAGHPATKVFTGIEENSYTENTLPWKDYSGKIDSVEVVDEGLAPSSLACWFRGFNVMTSCNVSKLDTSKATDMSYMFYDCEALGSLDLSKFDTSNVTNMSLMFWRCEALGSLDLSSFRTSKVTSMYGMFMGHRSLEFLNVSSFDTSNVTDMSYIFRGAESETSELASLDLSNFATSKTTNMKCIFYDCEELAKVTFGDKWQWGELGFGICLPSPSSTYIDGADGNWYASDGTAYTQKNIPDGAGTYYASYKAVPKTAFAVYSATDNSLRFYKRPTPTVPTVGKEFDGRTATAVYDKDIEEGSYELSDDCPWDNVRSDIKSVDFVDKGVAPTSLKYWFGRLTAMTSCNLSYLDTSKATDMSSMFFGCSKLTTLSGLSELDTSSVTDMSCMFTDCSMLPGLDLGDFKTSSVTSMAQMFDGCSSLTELKVNTFDTSSVKNMSSMFRGCSSLTSLSFTYWNTSKVESMYEMFSDCSKLAFLYIDGFDTSNVKDMSYMFYGCSNLGNLGISNLNTSSVENMSYMFRGCSALASLDVSGFDTSKVSKMNSMFNDCSSLTSLKLDNFDTSNVTAMSYMFNGCSELGSLDLSKFDTSKMPGMSYMFNGCSKLAKVSLGKDWKWNGDNSRLPVPDSQFIDGADGNWYASDGTAYTQKNIPDGAGTYYASYKIVPKTAFAVYSADDNGLRFYKRPTAAVPDLGKTFEGHIATAVFDEDVEKASYFDSTLVPWKDYASAIKSVDFVDAVVPISLQNWFYGFSAMTSCGLSKLDTSNVTSTADMFHGCSSLEPLDVSGFDTSNVKKMVGMFFDCSSLKSLDLSNFDLSNVGSSSYMFSGCSKLATVKLGDKWQWQGNNCRLPKPDPQHITGADGNWYDPDGTAYAPKDIPGGAGTYSAIPPAKTAFAVYSDNDKTLTFYNRVKVPAVGDTIEGHTVTAVYKGIEKDSYTDETLPWKDYSGKIESVEVIDDNLAPQSLSYWFNGFSAMTSCKLSKLDTSKATDMSHMFYGCTGLTSLDVSKFNTSNVTNMSYMFACDSTVRPFSALTSLDLSNFNTSNVTNMISMFHGCRALTSLNVSNFDTSNVASMSYMFFGCFNLTSLDVSKFNTANVTDMSCMFDSCSGLKSLDVSGFDTSKVQHIPSMFSYCSRLESLDVSSFNTGNVTDMSYMFSSCSKLATVTFGEKWQWVGTNGCLPAQSSDDIDGADGNWYDSDGTAYAPKDIPNGTGTYNAYPPKTAFAVYSEGDGTLTFYNRSKVPAVGDTIEGHTVTAVYRDFENESYSSKSQRPWNDVASMIESVGFIDEGVAPTSLENWFSGFSAMTKCDVSKLDTSKATSTADMFKNCSSLTSLNVSSFKTSNVTKMSYMFFGCSGFTSLDVSSLNTSNVTDVSDMFGDCSGLTSLELGNLDTSKVTNMSYMFGGCSKLESLNVSKFNTSSATSMYRMFVDCSKLESLDVSKFDTSNVTSMSQMFDGCSELTSLELGDFDTSKVKYMLYMFRGCSKLESLDVSKFDTSNVTNMFYMFKDCSSLASLELGNFKTSNVTNMSYMFNGCSGLTSLDVSSFDTSKVTDMSYMFGGCSKLATVKLGDKWQWVGTRGFLPTPNKQYIDDADGNWYASDGTAYTRDKIPSGKADTYNAYPPKTAFAVYSADENALRFYDRSDVPAVGDTVEGHAVTEVYKDFENASYSSKSQRPWNSHASTIQSVEFVDKGVAPTSLENWFNGFSAMTKCDISKLDTSKVTSMSCMFKGCPVLKSVDVSGFDTSNVTDMSSMFACDPFVAASSVLTSLDVSGFDTSKVTSMASMFYSCSKLESLDVSKFDTSSVTNMSCMFYDCPSLTSLAVSSFDTSKVTDMFGMFGACSGLTSLDVSKFGTSNVTNMNGMFESCSKLESLDVSGFDTSNVKNMSRMFNGCSGLTSLDVSSFKTSSVTDMFSMFQSCSALMSLDLSAFDTSNVTDMSYLFYKCSGLTSLDVSKFKTSNVTNMSGMFEGSSKLESLDVSNFNTSSVTGMSSMFDGCSELKSLNLSSFVVSDTAKTSSMFNGCSKLATVSLGNNWKWVGTDGYLPTPDKRYIADADGNWYASDGTAYTRDKIPSGKADTYFASKNLRIASTSSSQASTSGDQAAVLSADAEGTAGDGATGAANGADAAGRQAASPVDVSLKASGVDFATATPVLVTLKGDSGCTYAVVDGTGRTVSLQPGRYRVSAVSPISTSGQPCTAIETFWVDVTSSAKTVSFNVSPAAGAVASDAAARVAEIEDWLHKAGGAVSAPQGSAILTQARQAASQAEA